MRALVILVTLLAMSSGAYAHKSKGNQFHLHEGQSQKKKQPTQDEVGQAIFMGILQLIINNQQPKPQPVPPKPKPPVQPPVKPKPVDKEGKAVLKVQQDGSLLVGKVFLERGKQKDTDVIKNLPRCRKSQNQRVSQVRLKVNKSDAVISKLVLVYQNGDREVLRVRPNYKAGTGTRWKTLDRKRCIKRIRIDGMAKKSKGKGHGHQQQSKKKKRAVVSIVGR